MISCKKLRFIRESSFPTLGLLATKFNIKLIRAQRKDRKTFVLYILREITRTFRIHGSQICVISLRNYVSEERLVISTTLVLLVLLHSPLECTNDFLRETKLLH